MKPARPVAPIIVSVSILGGWWLVAHNSGSGWVQVLGEVLFGVLLVGVLGPVVALARSRLHVSAAPSDAVAGRPLEIELVAAGRVRVRPVNLHGTETMVGPIGRRGVGSHVLTLRPEHRGLHQTLIVDVATAAPFALQWWTRRVHLPLPVELHIAPRTGRTGWPARRWDDGALEGREEVAAAVGSPRGARPYRPGDSRRHVHWRSTAHNGQLMVTEREQPSKEAVTVSVALPADPEAAERVAERALGTVVRLLEQGAPVQLATLETGGLVLALVHDRRQAGRRLARAIPGRPGTASPADLVIE